MMESEHYSISIFIGQQFNRFPGFVGSIIKVVLLALFITGLIILSYQFFCSNIDHSSHSITVISIPENYSQFNNTISTIPKPIITTIKPNHTIPDNSIWDPI